MAKSSSHKLLERVKIANTRLGQLSSGLDAQERLARSLSRASLLSQALGRMDRAHKAAQELESEADAKFTWPVLEPPPSDVVPLEWFDSGSGIAYVDKVSSDANALDEAVREAWSDFLSGLDPSLLDQGMVEQLRGTTDDIDEACDQLVVAMEAWDALPPSMPAPGDVRRAREIKASLDDAWEALAASGATDERIEFLERVGHGRVPLTLLTEDLIDWLRETGLAAQLYVSSTVSSSR